MGENVMEGVDVLNPPKKIVYVAGESLDFTFVPTRLTLESLKIMDGMKKGTITESEGFEQIIKVLAKLCSKTNPTITEDWFLDNTDIPMIIKMGQDLSGITDEKTEDSGEPAKN